MRGTERPAVSSSRWDPWGDIVSLREAMNTLLEESFVRPRPGAPSGPGLASSLALDVQETPEQFTVTASVPGVPASAIDIAVLGDTLRIRGHRQEETEEGGEGAAGCCGSGDSAPSSARCRCRARSTPRVPPPTSKMAC